MEYYWSPNDSRTDSSVLILSLLEQEPFPKVNSPALSSGAALPTLVTHNWAPNTAEKLLFNSITHNKDGRQGHLVLQDPVKQRPPW